MTVVAYRPRRPDPEELLYRLPTVQSFLVSTLLSHSLLRCAFLLGVFRPCNPPHTKDWYGPMQLHIKAIAHMDLNGWQNNSWPIYWTCLQNIRLYRTCIRSQELRVEQSSALDSRFQRNLTDGFHEITVGDFLPYFPYILASNCLYCNGISEKSLVIMIMRVKMITIYGYGLSGGQFFPQT